MNEYEMLETAWGIIANAGGGNWGIESADWKAAAEKWRDAYHQHLEDDRTALSEKWLRSVGFKPWPYDDDQSFDLCFPAQEELGSKCYVGYQTNGFYLVRMSGDDFDEESDRLPSESVELFNSRNMKKTVTRGQLRRLLKALGIELKQ